jgi:hypothetical protein
VFLSVAFISFEFHSNATLCCRNFWCHRERMQSWLWSSREVWVTFWQTWQPPWKSETLHLDHQTKRSGWLEWRSHGCPKVTGTTSISRIDIHVC